MVAPGRAAVQLYRKQQTVERCRKSTYQYDILEIEFSFENNNNIHKSCQVRSKKTSRYYSNNEEERVSVTFLCSVELMLFDGMYSCHIPSSLN